MIRALSPHILGLSQAPRGPERRVLVVKNGEGSKEFARIGTPDS